MARDIALTDGTAASCRVRFPMRRDPWIKRTKGGMLVSADGYLSLSQARDIIRRWLTGVALSDVTIRECEDPINDQRLDGRLVKYEVGLEPHDDRHPFLHIYVTDDGAVGVGLETRARVARRIRATNTSRRYVVGHEPAPITGIQLSGFLQAVETGAVFLVVKKCPVLPIIGEVRAVLRSPQPWFDTQMSPHWKWLTIGSYERTSRHTIIDFEPL
jgi:hypothetical protein